MLKQKFSFEPETKTSLQYLDCDWVRGGVRRVSWRKFTSRAKKLEFVRNDCKWLGSFGIHRKRRRERAVDGEAKTAHSNTFSAHYEYSPYSIAWPHIMRTQLLTHRTYKYVSHFLDFDLCDSMDADHIPDGMYRGNGWKKNYKCDIIPLSPESVNRLQFADFNGSEKLTDSADLREFRMAGIDGNGKFVWTYLPIQHRGTYIFIHRRKNTAAHTQTHCTHTHIMHTNELWISNRKQFSIIAFQLLPIKHFLELMNVRRISFYWSIAA